MNFTIKNIRKIKRDFKYIVVPEFQKRGAIHFHLLTNLTLQDNNIIILQKNNKYYSLKYWTKGFSNVKIIENDCPKTIIGYISKYMTEECDNRLFGFRKYTASQNLNKPNEVYLNTEVKREENILKNLLKGKKCIYLNNYQDNHGNNVIFLEYFSEKG